MISLLEQAQKYFALLSKGELSASEQLKMTVCKPDMDNNDIYDYSDFDRLKERTENLSKKYQPSRINLKAVDSGLMFTWIYLRLMLKYPRVTISEKLLKKKSSLKNMRLKSGRKRNYKK